MITLYVVIGSKTYFQYDDKDAASPIFSPEIIKIQVVGSHKLGVCVFTTEDIAEAVRIVATDDPHYNDVRVIKLKFSTTEDK